jgi:cell division protein FtsI (penicillin-binding protein 3)
MQMTFRAGNPRRRLIALFVGSVLVFVAVILRVTFLQTAGSQSLVAAGRAQRVSESVLKAQRGTIFARDGAELALSVPSTTIFANPRLVTDPNGTARVLGTMLGMTTDKQQALAVALSAKTKTFVYIARQVDDSLAAGILSLNLPGVDSYREDKRTLPSGEVGRSIIGRTDTDGKGTAGLELQYNAMLAGKDGERVRDHDAKGRSIPGSDATTIEPVSGSDLITTIDRSLQFQVEQALMTRVDELKAKGGSVVVMDTATGEILSIANVQRDVPPPAPATDPNAPAGTPVAPTAAGAATGAAATADTVAADPNATTDPNAVAVPAEPVSLAHVTPANLAAVEPFEPGSVAKVFSLSAVVDSGAATPDTIIDVPGKLVFNEGTKWRQTLSDAEPHPVQQMSMRDIIVHSSNLGTYLLSQKIGSDKLYQYFVKFGLGQKTVLNFPNETRGMLDPPNKWQGTEAVTVTYGYHYQASALQFAAAVNAVANHGLYVAPKLVKATIGDNGRVSPTKPSDTHRVISVPSSLAMTSMMKDVVCLGTGQGAKMKDISVAGKTGTAYKAKNGGYGDSTSRAYRASFVGFFPADAPKVTIFVTIDEPDPTSNDRFGGTAAAPLFAKVATAAIHELQITPTPGDTGCAPAAG